MAALLERFWNDERGNTTVDWLVLTAGIVLLGAAVGAAAAPGSADLASDRGVAVEDSNVGI